MYLRLYVHLFREVVKNKNKLLTLKNYGLGQSPSDFVFSYPDIKASKYLLSHIHTYVWVLCTYIHIYVNGACRE